MGMDVVSFLADITLVIAGLFISFQGVQIIRGKRQAKVKRYEYVFIEQLPAKEKINVIKTLGVLRVIFGLFLVGLGVSFLF